MRVVPRAIDPPYRVLPSFDGEAFACWLIAGDAVIDDDTRAAVARDLLLSGCRHAVCSGADASLWDDAIDLQSVVLQLDAVLPPEFLCMTTWHEESIEETAEFVRSCVRLEGFEAERLLILGLGRSTGFERAVALLG